MHRRAALPGNESDGLSRPLCDLRIDCKHWLGSTLPGHSDTAAELYPPETKSLSEVAGLSGCAGVKFRRQEALCVERRGLGDEGRGAVCEGPLRGSD